MEIRSSTGISVYSAVQGTARRQEAEAPTRPPQSPEPSTQVSISEAAQAALNSAQSPDQLNSAELDALQKKNGLVNTWAYLSPAEKALYDQAVASGDAKAAEGFAQIALIRTGGMGAGKDGVPYDARNTEITADNIQQYFRHSVVDKDGYSAAGFDALAKFLQGREAFGSTAA